MIPTHRGDTKRAVVSCEDLGHPRLAHEDRDRGAADRNQAAGVDQVSPDGLDLPLRRLGAGSDKEEEGYERPAHTQGGNTGHAGSWGRVVDVGAVARSRCIVGTVTLSR
jgi:hypothetical protein